MADPGASAAPVRIRINYFDGPQETDAVPLGRFPGGKGELFRVARPSFGFEGVSREDVVRLQRTRGGYTFLGIVDRSAWETKWLLSPSEAKDMPEAVAEFKAAIAVAGCILDGEAMNDEGPCFVVSVPPGVSAAELMRAHGHFFQRTAGVSVEAFRAKIDEAVQQGAAERREKDRLLLVNLERRQRRGRIFAHLRHLLILAACVAAASPWVHALVTASVLARPRIAALGMIVALLPGVIATLVGGGCVRTFMLAATALGVLAYVQAGMPTDANYAFDAVVIGSIHALVVGAFAVAFFFIAGLSESRRGVQQAWFLLVLPSAASAIAAVVYVVTAAQAAHVQFQPGRIARILGIILTLLLLQRPLRRRTLGSIVEVLMPLAIIWVVVWLSGGLR